MTRPIMLDTGPLGKLAHPRPNPEIVVWLVQQRVAKAEIILPEIADYEVRRSLLLHDLTKSIARLDQLKGELTYLALNTPAMMKAAELWADTRKRGKPTADPQALDADVILAAQALQVNAIIVTENIDHLSLFVDAVDWRTM